MTAARPGSRWVNSLIMMASPVRTSGMTARRTRGSSRGSGISSHRWMTRTRSTPGWKTLVCSGRPTAGSSGRSCPACAATRQGHPGRLPPPPRETVYVVPITSDSEHFPPEGKLRVYRSRTGGDDWEALTKGLPQSNCYVNVLRDAMAVDSLDSCGVYFGTTGGQVYVSADAGDNWAPIVRDLPAVLSVEVQTLP